MIKTSACGTMCVVRFQQVLYLEQLLTTGGGWQDQVGGLMGGIKIGLSEAKLPIAVEAVDLKVSNEVIQMVNERLLLIYTGKTRLARNLLQVRQRHLFFSFLCYLLYIQANPWNNIPTNFLEMTFHENLPHELKWF